MLPYARSAFKRSQNLIDLEVIALILFLAIFLFILFGYPVAFTLGGLSAIVGYIALGPSFFNFLPSRIMGVMSNYVLIAVPLFVYMETMAMLFGKIRGGLAISVVIVGALLAASTGIVGATVITMGLISLPTMLRRNYQPELAAGTVASAGTLGQIIPPSVVLVLLGSVLNVNVGDLFKAALVPGLLLVGIYVAYILIVARMRPEVAPAIPREEVARFRGNNFAKQVGVAFVMPMLLMVAVLGSILAGIASPTEAAAVGAVGATLLTAAQGKFSMKILSEVMRGTTHLTAMVFMILIGATTFALVFRGLGGDDYLISMIQESSLSPMVFLIIVMAIVFVIGFFIDFIEIIFIVVPVVTPIFIEFDMNLIWIGILLALNLQTSFLSPPFGFSLFYLKGVAPEGITTAHIYRGIVPFLIIQVIFLALVLFIPDLVFLI